MFYFQQEASREDSEAGRFFFSAGPQEDTGIHVDSNMEENKDVPVCTSSPDGKSSDPDSVIRDPWEFKKSPMSRVGKTSIKFVTTGETVNVRYHSLSSSRSVANPEEAESSVIFRAHKAYDLLFACLNILNLIETRAGKKKDSSAQGRFLQPTPQAKLLEDFLKHVEEDWSNHLASKSVESSNLKLKEGSEVLKNYAEKFSFSSLISTCCND